MATAATSPVPPTAYSARSPFAWQRDGAVRHVYFPLLLLVAPIQSVLLTSVQGSTPAFLLTFLSVAALIGPDRRYYNVLLFCFGFALIYSVYLAISLSGYSIDQPDLSQLTVIRQVYIYGSLKQTNITQGIYLFAALLFCFVCYQYFQEAFIKYIFFGILALAIYGFYEFIFYAIFHTNGDFISNRNFGDLDTAAAGAGTGSFATGSLLQQSNIFGPNFMRLKSLVGEPSMYSLTVTPFVIYAYARRWWLIFFTLLLSLVLSSSTTALNGLAVGLGYIEVRRRQEFVLYIGAFLLIVLLLYFTADPVQLALNKLLFEKLDSVSGDQRVSSFINQASVVLDGNPIRSLFGLGFGTVRSTDMMSNLLANIGIIGFLGYTALILAPCFLLKNAPDRTAIIASLLGIFFMEMLTVSEFSYLPPWFIVALGYARVRQQRRRSPQPMVAAAQ